MEETGISMVSQIAGFIQAGGVFMGIILVVWGFGIAIAFERFRKLSSKFDVDGPSFWDQFF